MYNDMVAETAGTVKIVWVTMALNTARSMQITRTASPFVEFKKDIDGGYRQPA